MGHGSNYGRRRAYLSKGQNVLFFCASIAREFGIRLTSGWFYSIEFSGVLADPAFYSLLVFNVVCRCLDDEKKSMLTVISSVIFSYRRMADW